MNTPPRFANAALLLLCACVCLGPTAARAQQQNSATSTTASPASAPAKEETYVSDKNFRSRIFDIKNRDPMTLVPVLTALGSGFKGAMMTPSPDFKTITVRDFPENIAAIEEAIKRFDIPQLLDAGFELRLHVLIASDASGPASQAPEEIRGVIRELQSTLNFKNYYLIGSQIHRVKSNNRGYNNIEGSGDSNVPPAIAAATTNATSFPYRYSATVSSTIGGSPTNPGLIQLDNFVFETNNVAGNPRVRTSLTLRDGEKVVVGTANFKDKGLILILSAKGM